MHSGSAVFSAINGASFAGWLLLYAGTKRLAEAPLHRMVWAEVSRVSVIAYVLRLLPLVLLTGCISLSGPEPADTKFKEEDRDWVEVFKHELNVAIENKDYEAYYFFIQELAKEEYRREYGKEMDPNPPVRVIKD